MPSSKFWADWWKLESNLTLVTTYTVTLLPVPLLSWLDAFASHAKFNAISYLDCSIAIFNIFCFRFVIILNEMRVPSGHTIELRFSSLFFFTPLSSFSFIFCLLSAFWTKAGIDFSRIVGERFVCVSVLWLKIILDSSGIVFSSSNQLNLSICHLLLCRVDHLLLILRITLSEFPLNHLKFLFLRNVLMGSLYFTWI